MGTTLRPSQSEASKQLIATFDLNPPRRRRRPTLARRARSAPADRSIERSSSRLPRHRTDADDDDDARALRRPRRAARIARVALVLLLTFLLAPIAAVAAAKKPPPARGVKSDVKYVKCAVCQEVAKTLHRVAAKVREDKGKKLTEADVLEKVEKVCDPDAEEGEWLITHDLVERGKRLDMKHMGGKFGECGAECKTMQMACERIVSDRDTDVAEMLFTDGASLARAGIQAKLCNDANEKAYSACRKPAPALPKTRPKGPAFKEKDKKDVEMARLMKSMKGMGNGRHGDVLAR